MKKITIIRDKKLLILFAAFALLYLYKIVGIGDMARTIIEARGYPASPFIFLYVQLAVYAAIVWTMMTRLVLRVRFSDNSIHYGVLGLRSLGYDEIKKVIFGDSIELHAKGKTRKIPLINLEENEAKYEHVAEGLKQAKGLNIDVNQTVKKLTKRAYRQNTGEPNKFSPMLIILVAYLIFNVVTDGFYALFSPTQLDMQGMHPITVMVTCLVFMLGVLMAIYTANKHWRAPALIKIYLWAEVVRTIVTYVETFIIDAGSLTVQDYIGAPVSLAIVVLFAMTVARSLDISVNSQNTFVRERLLLSVFKKSDLKMRHSVRSWRSLLISTAAVLLAAVIFPISIISAAKFYMLDKNEYSSMDDLLERNYGGKDTEYLDQDGYYLVLAESGEADVGYIGELYYATSYGKIVKFNSWHSETRDHKIRILNYLPYLIAYVHNGKYILMLIDDIEEAVRFYDSFGDIEPVFTAQDNAIWYFKTIDISASGEGYTVNVDVDGETEVSVDLQEMFKLDP